jgi:hypothetical protein
MTHDTATAIGPVDSFMKKHFLVTPAKKQVKTDLQIKTIAMYCNNDSKRRCHSKVIQHRNSCTDFPKAETTELENQANLCA